MQGGVLVLSPLHHRQILEDIYFRYEETEKGNYEMRALSYELIKAGVVQWIDHRFNLVRLAYKSLYYPFLFGEGSESHRASRPEADSLAAPLRNRISSGARAPRPREFEKLCATTAFLNSFFLHFAGAVSEMELVEAGTTSWRELLT